MSEETKKRRIKGESFWKLKGFHKKLEKKQTELKDWQEQVLERENLYPDQVNFGTGAVKDFGEGGKPFKRIPYADVKKARAFVQEISEIEREMMAYIDTLAKQLHTWPDCISVKDGSINDENVEGVDPDRVLHVVADDDEAPAVEETDPAE